MEMAAFALRWATDLKQTANALASPIYSLPIEILKKILQGATDGAEPGAYYSTLHCLRSVSARWSQTILHMPALWTRITARMPAEAIDLAVQRSQDLPMTFEYNQNHTRRGTPVHKVVDELIAIQGRCSSLSVRTWRSDANDVNRLFGAPFPAMKTFALSCIYSENHLDLDDSFEAFLTTSPKLQDVTILHWNFRWSSTTSTGIRSLTLSDIAWGDQKFEDLKRMLSCCSQLERLHITKIRFHPPQNGLPSETKEFIYLPLLKEISLDIDYVDSAALLLDALVIPQQTRVLLDTHASTEYLHSEAFGRWMTNASKGWACSDSIVFEEDGFVCSSINYGEGHFRIITILHDVDSIFKLLSWIDVERRTTTMSVELSHWYLMTSSSKNWLALLAQMFPAATRFTFHDEADHILNELSTTTSEFWKDRTTWLFPSLQHLAITEAVSAADLIRFTSARHAAADAGETARLVDITTVELEGTEGERRILEQLIPIFRR